MSKKEKTVLGLFLDGLTLRVAECQVQFESIYVKRLVDFELKQPLIEPEINELDISDIASINTEEDAGFSFSKPKDIEAEFEHIDDFMGLNDDDDFLGIGSESNAPTPPAEDENFELDEITINEEIAPQYNLGSSVYFEISKFLNQFPLDTALVSFITTEDKLFWTYIPYSAKKIKKEKIKKQSLSKEQKKNPSVQFNLFVNNNKSAYSLVYEGQHDVINMFDNVQPILKIKNINYFHTEPLESTLINAALTQYKFEKDEYVLLLYLSKENKTALILQNDNYIKSIPLVIQASDPDIIREAIVSKIMLEQDISQLNITQNIIIFGDFISEEDIDFFILSFKSNYIDTFAFNKEYTIQNELPIEFNPEINKDIIPKYVPSIMLAYRAINAKSKRLHLLNLLPQQIIDKQKIFKLSWHGILIMIFVFLTTLWSTYDILQKKIEVKGLQAENQTYDVKINEKKAFQNILFEYSSQVDFFEQNRVSITGIIGKSNQWAHIISKFSSFVNNHSYFWIQEISGGELNLFVRGTSYNKGTIEAFSNILPKGNIRKINLTSIENEPVWTYEIGFEYPDPALYNPLFTELKVDIDTLAIREAMTKMKAETEPIKEEKKQSVEPKKETKKEKIEEKKADKQPETKQKNNEQSNYKEGSAIYTKARKNVQNNKYDQAIEGFTEFLAGYPKHRLVPMANFLMGESYFLSNRYLQALPYYQKVLELKKVKQVESLYQLGCCHQYLDDNNKAIEYFSELVRRYPKSYKTKEAKAKLGLLKGDTDEE
ncbi:MAG TPA: tetratricopeptide repeat protein [Candidatus Cloacimonadota bacterium]|nr:tetratricopeptide repeat protein [Candidatus Cloacimonadota bacterium]HQB41655.1 tetratricopeptide repeat protein [Candidatus Cloacimonadota bacterium]